MGKNCKLVNKYTFKTHDTTVFLITLCKTTMIKLIYAFGEYIWPTSYALGNCQALFSSL